MRVGYLSLGVLCFEGFKSPHPSCLCSQPHHASPLPHLLLRFKQLLLDPGRQVLSS